MVRKLINFFAYFLFFIFALMLFVPKDGLYFLLEKNLKQYDVIISQESLKESLLSLNVEHLALSVKAVDAALVEQISISLFGVYNTLKIEEIELSSLVEAYMPAKISSFDATYSLLHPLEIRAYSEGEFGSAKLTFNLQEHHLDVKLAPSKLMLKQYKNSLKEFKKSETGEYSYAKDLY